MALPIRRSGGNGEGGGRWDPVAQLDRLNEQLHEYLGSGAPLRSLMGEGFTPLADVEESDDAYLVEVELPGVKGDDIDVEVAGRRLTVSGERKARERVGILRRQTRTVGRFHYEVVLPGDVAEDEVEAALNEGVLTIRVPKVAADRPKRIPVK
ncbi:MAG TPA: Hsp20/alpha crystallin family protein [Acidimicrobiales bacterium]|nr:Hsp20/alpha crystallin family protein [Acidimicrobiales bacterium]